MDSSAPQPAGRPRAPTITVDTAAIDAGNDDAGNAPVRSPAGLSSINTDTLSSRIGNPASVISSPLDDANTLAVPPSKSRSESWSSSPTTKVGSDHDRDIHVFRQAQKGDINEILKADPGEEHLYNVENNPFAFSPGHLSKLINPKNLSAFAALGGLPGLEKGLRTDSRAGLSLDEGKLSDSVSFEDATAATSPSDYSPKAPKHSDTQPSQPDSHGKDKFVDRTRVYGPNRLPEPKSKSLLELAWIALQDRVLILLSVAAVVSLALGLYQTFGVTHHEGAKIEWVEGVAIIVAITIVVVVGALNDWQKERQFRKLNQKKEDRLVKVTRSGKPMSISIHDVLVGDVMLLEPGDVIPVDGVFIGGHNLSCDESSATGESDLIKKVPADAVLHALLHEDSPKLKKLDPFIISGAKVLDGVGTFLVTAVGQQSSHGKTMMSLRDDPGLTPLQAKLNLLAGYIAKLGSAAGLLLFFVLLIEFLVRLPNNDDTGEQKGQSFLRILITSITIIVVAVPEGLPLAVTLSLAFATKKMTKENNLVRHLQSCETMGNATVICSDKTGTLTENVMTVVAGSLGKKGQLVFGESNFEQDNGSGAKKDEAQGTDLISLNQLSSKLDPEYQTFLKTAITVNTTAFESEENGKQGFVGTKTETALLDWARRCLGLGPLAIERSNHPVTRLFPFNSQRKCMGAVVEVPGQTKDKPKYRLFIKGASEIVLAQCTTILGDPTKAPSTETLSDSHKEEIRDMIFAYATNSLRTLALAYRDFESWPPVLSLSPSLGNEEEDSKEIDLTDLVNNLTWIGVVGIQDPVRKGVPEAVQDCATASVSVKMVTGDNVETARAIGRECGILTEENVKEKNAVMEGSEFRKLDERERAQVVKGLHILARSSPEDKRILVKALRAQGQIVAVTGDGTNDAPALKAADVGFSMGITGTEVAKEASDIILMDDNFSSIVKALAWGRAINDSVKKFLQFQLTVNITAVFITFISAVSDDEETSVLNAVQLLWVNLIMDTFAALALATDPPTGSLLHREPEPRTAPLITITMWKMIIGQSIYQLIVCFVLWFAGPDFLGYPEKELRTLIFNVFVFMQIFKLVNSRRIDNRLNIFEGLHRNHLFMLMMSIMVGGQLIIIYVGGEAFVVVRLNGIQWAISVVLGFFSIPIGVLIRLFPDRWFQAIVDVLVKLWPKWLRLRRKKKSPEDGDETPTNPEDYDLGDALFGIRDDLEFLKKVRGGRMAAFSDAMAKSRELMLLHRHRSESRSRSKVRSRRGSSRSSNRPPISPMMSVVGMPGIVAASVGGLGPSGQSVNERSENP
ncbi:Calcium-transporting ATPase [Fusarium falciforme]|uniref:Calcium-transporting ATPase n=1 Tax=Fusarium falciforme TaxID=195108 RepID=UPI002300B658|nr:Calcium-transporting ATPase [Fusarium falciforme]WAO91148.1 Calcium-transporting ATPase [Fusarium falciforme]